MSTRAVSPSRDFFNPSVCNSKDPQLMLSRVFVGNLPTDATSKEEFHNMFSKFGKLLGSAMHKGFGFLQYEREEDARAAVTAMFGSIYKDYKIDIKMALEGRKRPQQPPPTGRTEERSRLEPYERPIRSTDPYERRAEPYERPRDLYERSRENYERSRGGADSYGDRGSDDHVMRRDERMESPEPFSRRPYDPPDDVRRESHELYLRNRDMYDRPPAERSLVDRSRDLDRGLDRARELDRGLDRSRELDRGLERSRDLDRGLERSRPVERVPLDPPHRVQLDPPSRERMELDLDRGSQPAVERPPFDCSLILYSRQQMEYAESIESRLKPLAMLTDIHVLAPDSQVSTIVENLSKRKVPYAIVLNGQNAIHRSMTLNILHGSPQEHRNMPLEDAMNLLTRNFEKYLRLLREKPVQPNNKVLLPPDTQTSYLLNLLADGRHLTLDELQSVGDFISERKRRLMEAEGIKHAKVKAPRRVSPPPSPVKPVPPPPNEPSDILRQQAELQAKILNILNPTSVTTTTPTPVDSRPPLSLYSSAVSGLTTSDVMSTARSNPPISITTSSVSSLDLGNPNIQKALDSLMSSGGDIMRSINTTAPLPVSEPISSLPGMRGDVSSLPAGLTSRGPAIPGGLAGVGPGLVSVGGQGLNQGLGSQGLSSMPLGSMSMGFTSSLGGPRPGLAPGMMPGMPFPSMGLRGPSAGLLDLPPGGLGFGPGMVGGLKGTGPPLQVRQDPHGMRGQF